MLVFQCPGQVLVTKDYALVASSFSIQHDRDERNCAAWWRAPYDLHMFNGFASPSTGFLTASAADVIRIRMLNPVAATPYPISLSGYVLKLSFNGGTHELPRPQW